jgi:hypothetical protein
MRFVIFSSVVLLAAISFGGCGSDDTTPNAIAGDASTPDAGGVTTQDAAPLGSATLTGTGSFSVFTSQWLDAGPFDSSARVQITLATDPSCQRKACANWSELFLRLSSPAGGSLPTGTYSIDTTDASALAGGLEAKVTTNTATANSCGVDDNPANSGTVTVDTLTSTEIKGSFSLQMEAGSGSTLLTGTFDALTCP